MKKTLCFFLATLLALSCAIGVCAYNGEGLTLTENEKYTVDKALDSVPLSFEAWLSLPFDAPRAGVVIGNYAGSTACVNFEITTNGRPRLYVVEYTTGEKVVHDVTFKSVDVRKDEAVHVAIVHDPAKAETYCYIDGVLAEKHSGVLNINEECIETNLVLAGDRRSGNSQYFKGALEEVALYSDVRSAEEIKKDMIRVDENDDALILWYDTTVDALNGLKDKSGNGYDVSASIKWISNKAPVTGYEYSFCVVGDTQVVAYKEPEKLANIYDWIIANKDEKKIEFVFGLGDITDKSTDAEWTAAKAQIYKMNGVVPYSLVRGNHDGTAKYNQYFNEAIYTSQFEGFFESGKLENSWRAFSVGETDYLLITLDYGASDTILNWAAGIIEAHPEHRVIITTHCYLFRDGTTLDAGDVCPPNTSGSNDGARNNGDQMWDKLVSKHENIFLVLSGHDPSEDVVATQSVGDHGNTVTQILVDPQGIDSSLGATGMVAMLYFTDGGKSLTVEQYSTVRGQHYMNTSQFTLPLTDDSTTEDADSDKEETRPDDKEIIEETEVVVDPETQAPESGNSGDIGIIGGADGPTAIFVAGKIWPVIAAIAAAGVAIGFALGFIVGKKSKK